MANAIKSEPNPEPNPLIITICNGSFSDSTLVQLFSSPQQIQANRTNIEPKVKYKLPSPCIDNNIHAKVIKPMPHHRCFDNFSLNITNAITDVATISKLFIKEAFAAVVLAKPIIKKMGAIISNTTIPTV